MYTQKKMKVTILQTDITWASPADNVERVRRLLHGHEGSDLYVLPEMWATGFATAPHDIAEGEDSIALKWMQQTAREQRCAVSGSLLIHTADGLYRNRHYFVTPTETMFYDKHHLFSYGRENEHITPGDCPVIVTWQGRRFLLLTCYDIRFPVWSRWGRAGEYDAIIVVANWPDRRQQAWDVLTRARAIENQCYVIAANRVGDDPVCHYQGLSRVCGPRGDVLMECHPESEECGTTILDFNALDHARSRFRVLDDRDRFAERG